MPAAIPKTQTRITLRQRPKAAIDPDLSGSGTFNIEKNVALPSAGDLKEGEVLIAVEWLSLDPAMRGWLNDSRSYIPPVKIGEVMRSGGVGRVVAVGPPHPKSSKTFTAGEWVYGQVGKSFSHSLPRAGGVAALIERPRPEGWQEYAVLPGKEVDKIHVSGEVSPSYYLGALGMPGQTAYWGLEDVAKIKAGETVVISGAAGAVGTTACQIAKIKGCKVIAIAGGADKCKFLVDEIGVDAALDYKSPSFAADFRKTVGYLDVYFDNVGGDILDLCLTRLKKNARIAICGAISAYNDPNPKGIKMYLNLISQRAKIEGFIVFDYADRYHVADADLAKWLKEGKLKVRESRLVGLDQCVNGLIGLFSGANTGKAVVKVGGSESKL